LAHENHSAPPGGSRHHEQVDEPMTREQAIGLGLAADRLIFGLSDAAWAELSAILDRPARPIPALAELLHQAAPWDDVP